MNESYPPPPEFLHWLDKFLGKWKSGESEYYVDRRDDGWLRALRNDGEPEPLSSVLKQAKKISEPDGPLGRRPVFIGQELMDTWLTEEELQRFQGAFHVSIGRERLLTLLEQRMCEADPMALKHWREQQWIRGAQALQFIPFDDERVYSELFLKFRLERCGGGASCRYLVDGVSLEFDLPDRRPRSAKYLGSLRWWWSQWHSRSDDLYISRDRSRSRWVLWLDCPDCPEVSKAAAWVGVKDLGLAPAAALLIPFYYANEEFEFDANGRPNEVWGGILTSLEWMQAIERAWPAQTSADVSLPKFRRVNRASP